MVKCFLALRDFSRSNKNEDSHKELPWFPAFPPWFHAFPPISRILTQIPRIPILIPRILTLIPRIPTILLPIARIHTLIPRVPIIPLIPFPDSPFRLLQIAISNMLHKIIVN